MSKFQCVTILGLHVTLIHFQFSAVMLTVCPCLLSMTEDAKANKVSVFLKNTNQTFITETVPDLRCAERLGFISVWGSKVTLKLSCHNFKIRGCSCAAFQVFNSYLWSPKACEAIISQKMRIWDDNNQSVPLQIVNEIIVTCKSSTKGN